ncbi:MAG: RNA-guided pseudouridylation complex pseudouridine synthase subunit Cbf5 [Candidatus Pacearchaeota archaeon]
MNIGKIKSDKTIKELLEFGIINIDKPSGPTSFNVSDFVRRKLDLRKTSHFGTLDPKVTGVLPIALNRACKLTGFFLGEDKEYVGVMSVHEKIDKKTIEKIIKENFMGKITQLPPVKSRVKRQERVREIKSFKILEQEDKNFLFKVECEGGTYIRKLVHDLGEELGTGAHMLELRRIRAGIFKEDGKKYPSVNLYDFEKAVEEYEKGNEKLLRKIVIPGEIVSELYPAVQVKKNYMGKLFNGSPLHKKYIKDKKLDLEGEKFCAFSNNKFIGVYRRTLEKEILGRPLFVLQPLV